jgi:ribosome-binding protein aMBF1 (putative translation factor)
MFPADRLPIPVYVEHDCREGRRRRKWFPDGKASEPKRFYRRMLRAGRNPRVVRADARPETAPDQDGDGPGRVRRVGRRAEWRGRPDPIPTRPAAVDPPDGRLLMARFGGAVRRRRDAAGLTQGGLAGRAKIHPATVGLIERGRQSPTLEMVGRLAAALGTTAAALLAEAESPDPPADVPDDG